MSTRDEQRTKLATAMRETYLEGTGGFPNELETWLAALDAIGTAGFCVVAPEPTEEMMDYLLQAGAVRDRFRAMVLNGNLAGAPK